MTHNLTDDQWATLRQLRNRGGDLTRQRTVELIDRWCSKANRSRLDAVMNIAKTMGTHRDCILVAAATLALVMLTYRLYVR